MSFDDPAETAERVGDLEAEIEELLAVAERCRKAMVLSRIAIAFGCLLMLASFSGLLPTGAALFTFAVSASLGGIVFLGANRSTLLQTRERLRVREELRSRLLDMLPMRRVSDRGGDPDG